MNDYSYLLNSYLEPSFMLDREYELVDTLDFDQSLRGSKSFSQRFSIQNNISQNIEEYFKLLELEIKMVYYEYFCLSLDKWKEVKNIYRNLGVYNSFNFFKKGDIHFSFGLIFSDNQVHIFIEARSSSLKEVYVKNLFYSNQIIISDILVDIRIIFDGLKNYFEINKLSDEKNTSLLDLL